jgi:Zn-dependent peptidase ImmA (M78 family)
MYPQPVEGADEIRRLARSALNAAGVGDVDYVPLDDVTAAVKLKQVDLFADAENLPPLVARAARKLRSKIAGALAVKTKTIYIDPDLVPGRRRFTVAHEIGHDVLPWQQAAYADDHHTLGPEAKAEFEREANVFAGELLFGAGRFNLRGDDEAPGIAVPLAAAALYGTSAAASLRQYVEYSARPLALLAVSRYITTTATGPRLRIFDSQSVISQRFSDRFGPLSTAFPADHITASNPLFHALNPLQIGVGDTVKLTLDTKRGKVEFQADTFCNKRLRFVLIYRRNRFSGRQRVLVDVHGKAIH